MATSTIKRKKVKIRKTAEQLAAEKAAEEAALAAEQEQEWREYLAELLESVGSGDLDFALAEILEKCEARGQQIGLYESDTYESEPDGLASLRGKLASQIERANYDNDPAYGTAYAGPVTNRSDLLNKVVRLNDTIAPRWAAGLRVKVIKCNTRGALVEWWDDPTKYSNSGLANAKQFRCMYRLLDVQWANGVCP